MRCHHTGRSWTDADVAELKQFIADKTPDAEISKATGRSISSIANRKHILLHGRRKRPSQATGAPSGPANDWTPERVETLTQLWKEGVSCSRIAAFLDPRGGLSRNAVIGKVHRLGLMGRAAPSQPGKANRGKGPKPSKAVSQPKRAPEPRSIPVNRGGVTAPTIVRRAELEPVPLPVLREVQSLHARPWTEREPGQCSWPISGEGAETLSCCAPAYRRGWCRPHFLIGTVPVKRPISTGKVMRRAA